LELSFRAVLPNLLHALVLPSSSGNLTYSFLHHYHYQLIIQSIISSINHLIINNQCRKR
jgi:hypothetical protein